MKKRPYIIQNKDVAALMWNVFGRRRNINIKQIHVSRSLHVHFSRLKSITFKEHPLQSSNENDN